MLLTWKGPRRAAVGAMGRQDRAALKASPHTPSCEGNGPISATMGVVFTKRSRGQALGGGDRAAKVIADARAAKYTDIGRKVAEIGTADGVDIGARCWMFQVFRAGYPIDHGQQRRADFRPRQMGRLRKPGSLPVRVAKRQRRQMFDRFLRSLSPTSEDDILDVGVTDDVYTITRIISRPGTRTSPALRRPASKMLRFSRRFIPAFASYRRMRAICLLPTAVTISFIQAL